MNYDASYQNLITLIESFWDYLVIKNTYKEEGNVTS